MDIEIQCVADEAAVAGAAAELFARQAQTAVNERGQCFVALSGGSTPQRTYDRLAIAPFLEGIPWAEIEFFWADERPVAADHPESNYRLARERLLEAVGTNRSRIHRMPADQADLDAAAAIYQGEIARAFAVAPDGPPPAFDLIMLGMGVDGHTASLFPHTQALKPTARWVVANDVPALGAKRMTMTPALINRGRCVTFLVQGAEKAKRLAEVVEGPLDIEALPSQLIRPESGRLVWLVDRAAAARLSGRARGPVRAKLEGTR